MGALSVRLEQEWCARGAAVMGVLNATPDSFFDGGIYNDATSARARVDALIEAGADIIDIGGESTRPGAAPVAVAEQIARIESAVVHAVARGAVVSVDTSEPAVAERMFELGAAIANDISCLSRPALAGVCARHQKILILMHSRGPMQNMPGFSQYPEDAYADVVEDVLLEWRRARDRALAQGLAQSSIWLDPGLGFAKNARQSFQLLHGLERFGGEGVPIVVGPSRKSFIGALDQTPPERRLGGSIAAALLAVEKGAKVVRVHDVAEVRQALSVARSVRSGELERGLHV